MTHGAEVESNWGINRMLLPILLCFDQDWKIEKGERSQGSCFHIKELHRLQEAQRGECCWWMGCSHLLRNHPLTFQVLQLFRFGPSGLLSLRVVVVRLSCVWLVLLPGAFRKQLLKIGENGGGSEISRLLTFLFCQLSLLIWCNFVCTC